VLNEPSMIDVGRELSIHFSRSVGAHLHQPPAAIIASI
jgi:hypothetical protein